jgi:flagellar transcriptional activator FlhC
MRLASVVEDARQVNLAISLIRLGARLQVLESETQLSRERLLKLYKEVQGKSPPKGMLPFSADWFTTWQPNIHASLFVGIYAFLIKQTNSDGIEAVFRAYRLYREHLAAHGMPEVLSFTRAWTLVRFFDGGILTTTGCRKCAGNFVVHAQDLHDRFVCGLCDVPSRAGKTRDAVPAEAPGASLAVH